MDRMIAAPPRPRQAFPIRPAFTADNTANNRAVPPAASSQPRLLREGRMAAAAPPFIAMPVSSQVTGATMRKPRFGIV